MFSVSNEGPAKARGYRQEAQLVPERSVGLLSLGASLAILALAQRTEAQWGHAPVVLFLDCLLVIIRLNLHLPFVAPKESLPLSVRLPWTMLSRTTSRSRVGK